MTNFLELADRVQATDTADDKLRHEIAIALGWTSKQVGQVIAWYAPGDPYMKAGPPNWLGSVDAAITLVPDGYCVSAMGQVPDDLCWYVDLWQENSSEGEPEVRAQALPLALTAAALRAKAGIKP